MEMKTISDRFERFLRARGLRLTRQRAGILRAIYATHKHVTAEQFFDSLQRSGESKALKISRATVYRTLTLLEEVGVLQHSHLETGAEYHRSEDAQHVHLSCSRCGRDDALTLVEAGRLASLIRAHHGFEADLTHFAITGLCADCASVSRAS